MRAPGSPLNISGVPSISNLNNLGLKDVIAIASLGFAYCYIASAPMLLLHATRAQIGINRLRARWLFWTGIAAAIIVLYLLTLGFGLTRWSSSGFAPLVAWIVLGFQAGVIADTILDRFKTLSAFYLATARGREERPIAEDVESYRHLREHGNAFAILTLEITLAFVLVSARRANLFKHLQPIGATVI